ncbi:hypothetical protein C8J56DRAFT_1110028 [Mycena floridula]|nr:hypothetical protein C8J56DRAFT_1110028 [Mycena floridula]
MVLLSQVLPRRRDSIPPRSFSSFGAGLARKAESPNKRKVKKRQSDQKVADRKAHKELNKLVTDKWDTLHEFELCEIITDNDASELPAIQWRKTFNKQYDIATRQWVACLVCTEFQPTGLLWFSAEDIDTKQLETMVTRFSQSMKSAEEKKKQIFIMIYGLQGKNSVFQTRIREALDKLQFIHRTHHLFSETIEDAVTRLSNISADLGKDPRDTLLKMLGQVSGVSESAARGIVSMEAYQAMHDKKEMLSTCKIALTPSGKARQAGHDTLETMLSTRIYTVFCGEDHLGLVTRNQNSG